LVIQNKHLLMAAMFLEGAGAFLFVLDMPLGANLLVRLSYQLSKLTACAYYQPPLSYVFTYVANISREIGVFQAYQEFSILLGWVELAAPNCDLHLPKFQPIINDVGCAPPVRGHFPSKYQNILGALTISRGFRTITSVRRIRNSHEFASQADLRESERDSQALLILCESPYHRRRRFLAGVATLHLRSAR